MRNLLWFVYFITALILMLFCSLRANAQKVYPLSRQDSALILKHEDGYTKENDKGKLKEASRHLNKIAMIYWEHNQYEKAIDYYDRSLKINTKLGNENGMAMIHNNLAMIYSDVKNFEKSRDFFNKTLAARRSKKEKIGIISACINLSVVLNNMNLFDESVEHLQEALTLARELNDPEQMRSCYGMLSETYEKAGDTKESIYYFNLYRSFHEMVAEEKIAKSKEELENEHLKRMLAEEKAKTKELEVYKKEQEIEEKEELIAGYDSTTQELRENLSKRELSLMVIKKNMQIRDLERQQEQIEFKAKQERAKRTIQTSIGVGIVLFLLIGVLLYAYRQKRKTNKQLSVFNTQILKQSEEITQQRDQLSIAYGQIETKNTQITDSINYAQLIQAAMLDRQDKLQAYLKHSFILYLPRDIVSGDFYWYRQVDGKMLIAAVDCTGHGVPGAFMSMIGYNLLNHIVEINNVTSPDEILKLMDEGIKKALNQKHTKNQDGMDMTLCVIDKENKKLEFAGAKNPMVLIRDNVLENVRGSRYSVGGFPRKIKATKSELVKVFEKKTFELSDMNYLYLFSDGFSDQFGGKTDKKYTSNRLRKLLFENYKKDMNEQLQVYLDEFNVWKEGTYQIDDILLIGGVIDTRQL